LSPDEHEALRDHEQHADRAADAQGGREIAECCGERDQRQCDERVPQPELGDLAERKTVIAVHSPPRLNAATSPAKAASVTESAATEKRYGASGITRA
jgi:hypothetical protein